MSLPAEIPGFYYDPVKKRYFRLLANHAAPTTSFYTAANVQRQQQEQQRQYQQLQEESCRLKRPFTSNPLIQCTLGRELGSVRSFDQQEARRRVYALGLEHRRLWDLGVGGNKIVAFVTDGEKDGTLVVGDNGGGVMSVPMAKDGYGYLKCDRSQMRSLHHFPSQVTSACLSRKRMLMASCLGDTRSPSVFRVRLPEPNSEDYTALGQSLAFSDSVRSIWTSTVSTQTGDVALGASTGVIYMREHPNDWNFHHFQTGSDVFAVEFLAVGPPVLLSGSRDGAMRLFDMRVRQNEANANSSSLVIRHKSSITHIRHLNEVTMVVHGPQKCALYDLRFPHPGSPSRAFVEPTQPVMAYEKVHDGGGYMLTLGFDVCKERQVMVVANEDRRVRLFSMDTGNVLESSLGKKEFRHACEALRFSGEERGGVESIIAVDGPVLEHYAI